MRPQRSAKVMHERRSTEVKPLPAVIAVLWVVVPVVLADVDANERQHRLITGQCDDLIAPPFFF
jgi:hypothetical protein